MAMFGRFRKAGHMLGALGRYMGKRGKFGAKMAEKSADTAKDVTKDAKDLTGPTKGGGWMAAVKRNMPGPQAVPPTRDMNKKETE